VGAADWVGRSLKELKNRAGEQGCTALLQSNPARIVTGQPLES
jgi:hypothetical protein